MHVHGWVDTLEGGHIVCPSDWIITGVRGEYYPIKNDIFLETYIPVKNDYISEDSIMEKLIQERLKTETLLKLDLRPNELDSFREFCFVNYPKWVIAEFTDGYLDIIVDVFTGYRHRKKKSK